MTNRRDLLLSHGSDYYLIRHPLTALLETSISLAGLGARLRCARRPECVSQSGLHVSTAVRFELSQVVQISLTQTETVNLNVTPRTHHHGLSAKRRLHLSRDDKCNVQDLNETSVINGEMRARLRSQWTGEHYLEHAAVPARV